MRFYVFKYILCIVTHLTGPSCDHSYISSKKIRCTIIIDENLSWKLA